MVKAAPEVDLESVGVDMSTGGVTRDMCKKMCEEDRMWNILITRIRVM